MKLSLRWVITLAKTGTCLGTFGKNVFRTRDDPEVPTDLQAHSLNDVATVLRMCLGLKVWLRRRSKSCCLGLGCLKHRTSQARNVSRCYQIRLNTKTHGRLSMTQYNTTELPCHPRHVGVALFYTHRSSAACRKHEIPNIRCIAFVINCRL